MAHVQAGGERGLTGGAVEGRHHLDRGGEDLARRLVPRVQHAAADWLGQRERQAGPAGVDAQQRGRIGEAGDRHPVLRLGVVDAVAARDMSSPRRSLTSKKPPCSTSPASSALQLVAQPGQQVERDQGIRRRRRTRIRERVGRGDLAEGAGVVDDRGEKVRGGHDRSAVADPNDRGVVAVLHPDEQIGIAAVGDQPRDGRLQLTGRDLARAAAAARELGQADSRGREVMTVLIMRFLLPTAW